MGYPFYQLFKVQQNINNILILIQCCKLYKVPHLNNKNYLVGHMIIKVVERLIKVK